MKKKNLPIAIMLFAFLGINSLPLFSTKLIEEVPTQEKEQKGSEKKALTQEKEQKGSEKKAPTQEKEQKGSEKKALTQGKEQKVSEKKAPTQGKEQKVSEKKAPTQEREQLQPLKESSSMKAFGAGFVYVIKNGTANLLKFFHVLLIVTGLLFFIQWLSGSSPDLTLLENPNNTTILPLPWLGPISVLIFLVVKLMTKLLFYLLKYFKIIKENPKTSLITIKAFLFMLLNPVFCYVYRNQGGSNYVLGLERIGRIFSAQVVGYLLVMLFDFLFGACYEVADLSFDLYA